MSYCIGSLQTHRKVYIGQLLYNKSYSMCCWLCERARLQGCSRSTTTRPRPRSYPRRYFPWTTLLLDVLETEYTTSIQINSRRVYLLPIVLCIFRHVTRPRTSIWRFLGPFLLEPWQVTVQPLILNLLKADMIRIGGSSISRVYKLDRSFLYNALMDPIDCAE